MPAFVVLPDPGGWPKGGAPAWGNGYLPAAYQGTVVRGGASPIAHLATPAGITDRAAAADARLHRRGQPRPPRRPRRRLRTGGPHRRLRTRLPHAGARAGGGGSVEGDGGDEDALRPRPQGDGGVRHRAACSPGGWSNAACGSCSSTAATPTAGTATPTWRGTTARCACRATSRSRGCSTDLKRRGLLKDTLVIWGGEFGRTPMTEGTNGRDHNPHGFCMWLAGGGVKGGTVVGATDADRPARRGGEDARPRRSRDDPAPAWASTTSG